MQAMPSINALFLTLDVNDWLLKTHHPRVLHIFHQACNLINEHREVLSIVTPQIGDGPFNLVIPRLRKSFETLPDGDESQQTSEVFSKINLQSQVSNSANQLTLGNLTIKTADAKLWNPRPDWEKLHAKKYQIADQMTKFRIANYQFSNSLLTSLATADIPSALRRTSHLAGLGSGLTPAGDDFIMGALYAAWIIHPYDIASILAQEISNNAAPLTTSLSAAWLRAAGRGEVGILWHQFFDALVSANLTQIHQALDKILAVGETSGADALTGFIGTLESWREETEP
jgi:hypothetical protein